MIRSAEKILVIGDEQRRLRAVLEQALPLAEICDVENYFDAIAELSANSYTAVLAAVEPIERRPEAAIKTIRNLAGEARLVLFGHPTLEPLSRKMLEFGCDDYLVSPATPGELHQVFGAPRLHIAAPAPVESDDAAAPVEPEPLLGELPMAQILLDALLSQPADPLPEAVRQFNQHLSPTMQLVFAPVVGAAPSAEGLDLISHVVRTGTEDIGQLHLLLPRDQDAAAARHFLARLCQLLGRLQQLHDRHTRLQKLAITDELTGLYNARYFRHFLAKIIQRAKARRFPVTLFVFDIDNFKKYNDSYGHAAGDQILKQTAALARRCCREHDLVARIGGDEFAVVFWEKEGPRQPKEPKTPTPGRAPQTPLDILNRFRKLLTTHAFPLLGASGQGKLTISGGIAIYPYDARDMDELIAAADKELMFRAKQAGKNSIFLVGSDQQIAPLPPDTVPPMPS